MKHFEIPDIEILRFSVEDIITTSIERDDESDISKFNEITTTFRITGV